MTGARKSGDNGRARADAGREVIKRLPKREENL
jgi:hypothetical protein